MKLLVFDIEGTLFKTEIKLSGTEYNSTIWQAIAYSLGPDAVQEEIETHNKWKKGVYGSYIEWMKDTINIHKRYGLSKNTFLSIVNQATYNPGVVETFKQIDTSKYIIILISGGFRELAARAQMDLNIEHAFAACEYLFNVDGTIMGYNLLPCDFEGKISFIKLMLDEYKIEPEDWIFIGDGANDVPIAMCAPLSIGYQAHVGLAKTVTYNIVNFCNILEYL